MPGVAALSHDDVRAALRLLGEEPPPSHRAVAQRRLREILGGAGTVRTVLEQAPAGAKEAFGRLVQDGPADVRALLGRGWWGHGTLPPPLDWLQRRALVMVTGDALVHPVDEARDGFARLTLDLGMEERTGDDALRVEAAGSVVVAREPGSLDRVLTVAAAGLRAVSETVAVSPKDPARVAAALRAAGVPLAEDMTVPADPAAPALPDTAEDAVGPKAVRALLERAVVESRQLRLEYFASSRGGAATDRVVDPWEFTDDLLRGWCHLRTGERTFALDRIGRAYLLPNAVEHQPPPAT